MKRSFYGMPDDSASLRQLQKTRDYGFNEETRSIDITICDEDFRDEVDRRLAIAIEAEDPRNVRIPKSQSAALHLQEGLTIESIARMKRDKRYGGDPTEVDQEYRDAVTAAVKELAHAQEQKQAENERRANSLLR